MLILASQSPRRREILTMLGYDFTCRPAHADETIPAGIEPGRAVELLAQRKARAVLDAADAARMLRTLCGRTHTVYTGVALLKQGRARIFHQTAEVTFYILTEEEIQAYIASGEPMDKAGAYGIQGRGSALVEKINGDFYAVMGLPAGSTVRALREFCVYPAL